MTDPQPPSVSPPPRSSARLLARTGFYLGAAAMLIGLVLTVITAWLVRRQIDTASSNPAAPDMPGMKSFFESMNHVAVLSVAVTFCGMVLFFFSNLALSRHKKPPKPGS